MRVQRSIPRSFLFVLGIWLSFPWSLEAQPLKESLLTLPSLTGVPGYPAIQRKIKEWQTQLDGGQYRLAGNLLDDVLQFQADQGIPNFYALANLLLFHADRLSSAQPEAALRLYEKALEAAPALSEPLYRLAWLSFQNFAFPDGFYQLSRALSKDLRDIYQASRLLVVAGLCLIALIVFSFFLWWILLLLRSLRPFDHDFRDLFPAGISSVQIRMLTLLLLAMPLLMGSGLLETLFLWILISWFYQSWGERLWTGLGLLAISAAPLLLSLLGVLASLPQSPLHRLYLLNETEARYSVVSEIHEELQKNPRNSDLLWSLGLFYKREGELKKARPLLEDALKIQRSPGLLVTLGNLEFLEKNGETAFRFYQDALKADPHHPEAHYNISTVYKHSNAVDVIQLHGSYLAAARARGGERVERFMKLSQLQSNRYLLDCALPVTRYRERLLDQPDLAHLDQHFWSRLSVWLPFSYAPWTGLAFLFLLLLLTPILRLSLRGQPCIQCGTIMIPSSEKDDPEIFHKLCPQCISIFHPKGEVPVRRKVEKELEIGRYQRSALRLRLLLTCFSPGAGHVFSKRSFLGFFFLLFPLLSLILGWFWLFPFPNPFAQGSSLLFWTFVGSSFFSALLWLLAFRSLSTRSS